MVLNLPASVEMTSGTGSLQMIRLSTIAGSAEIFLHGAHLASWSPAGEEPVIWMSSANRFERSAPIRGGVPICFPWFGMKAGQPRAPQHGFARISGWELIGALESADTLSVQLRLVDTEESRASAWPSRFEATYSVTLGAELTLRLDVTNRDRTAFSFEEALHTYYAVSDSRQATVHGLENHTFLAKGATEVASEAEPVLIGDGISRKYTSASAASIVDGSRTIHTRAAGASGGVLWNPGAEIARDMADFADDEWTRTVCFEPTNIAETAVWLEPGETHSMSVVISVENAPGPNR